MAYDRSKGLTSQMEVPTSIKDFAAEAYSKESQILIADGMPEQTYVPPPERVEDKPAEKPVPNPGSDNGLTKPYPESWKQNPYPHCLPKLPIYQPGSYYYQPGTPHCRRPYEPVLPAYAPCDDPRRAYRHPVNPVVQSTMRIALELGQHPLLDSHPSEISRQDPSACFLNMVLQRVIHRQSMGNTIEQIAFTLGDIRDPNHFYKHRLGEEQPGDIIIAYPADGSRAEGAIYLGNSKVASFDPVTKQVSTTDNISAFYPPKDPKKPTLYGRVDLYRWADWKSARPSVPPYMTPY